MRKAIYSIQHGDFVLEIYDLDKENGRAYCQIHDKYGTVNRKAWRVIKKSKTFNDLYLCEES